MKNAFKKFSTSISGVATQCELRVCQSAMFLSLVVAASLGQVLQEVQYPSALPSVSRDRWWQIRPADRERMKAVCQLEQDQVNALLESDDPRDRALGIFILDQRGEVDRLVGLRRFMDDDRQTIPTTATIIGMIPGEYASRAQSVGEYLGRVYGQWLGFTPRNTAEMDQFLTKSPDITMLAKYWVMRLGRASDQVRAQEMLPEASRLSLAAEKEKVAALPPDVRWVVVWEIESYRPSVFNEAETKELVESAAAELGGTIDPETSRVWDQRTDLGPTAPQRAAEWLAKIAPDKLKRLQDRQQE